MSFNVLLCLHILQLRDFEGNSREVDKYIAKMEERAQQEEELFTRVPLSKMEKKKAKHLKKSRNGYEGCFKCDLTESMALIII